MFSVLKREEILRNIGFSSLPLEITTAILSLSPFKLTKKISTVFLCDTPQ